MNSENTAARIRRKLIAAFDPLLLEIEDESTQHAGHAGSRPGGETHFQITLVSRTFAGQSKVAAHRAVYAVLSDDMQEGGIHALSLTLAAEKRA